MYIFYVNVVCNRLQLAVHRMARADRSVANADPALHGFGRTDIPSALLHQVQ